MHLTPYHTRYTNLLHGSLRDISADTYTDDKTNTRYYKANIVVDHEDVKKVDENIVLSAGMPAEVFIRTGEHTLFTYLIEPFTRSFRSRGRRHRRDPAEFGLCLPNQPRRREGRTSAC